MTNWQREVEMSEQLDQVVDLEAPASGGLPITVQRKIEFIRRLGQLAKAASEWSTDALATPEKPLDQSNVDWFCDQIEAIVKDIRSEFGSAQTIKK